MDNRFSTMIPLKRIADSEVAATVVDPKKQKKAADRPLDNHDGVAVAQTAVAQTAVPPTAVAQTAVAPYAVHTRLPTMRWEFEEANKWWIHRQSASINEEVKNDKKTVILEVNGVPVSVKPDKMIQLKKSRPSIAQNMRVSFAEQSTAADWFAWEFEDNSSGVQLWKSYAFAVAQNLEKAFVNRCVKCPVKIGRKVFVFDIDLMLLEEKFPPKASPKITTNVRRIKSDAALAAVRRVSKKQAQKIKYKKRPKDAPYGTAENNRTIVAKGRAPVDPFSVEKIPNAHVYWEGDDVYDVMLNQSDMAENRNSFFLMQLLEVDGLHKKYFTWRRWGRVGNVGQKALVDHDDLYLAKLNFLGRFADKTGNEWCDRKNFQKQPGYYDLIKVDFYQTEVNKRTEELKAAISSTPESKLDSRVQGLIETIYDMKTTEEVVIEFKYDAKGAPLGKLTIEQLRAGFAVLKKIEQLIDKNASEYHLVDACDDFYTKIPHAFGSVFMQRNASSIIRYIRNNQPTMIRTKGEVQAKIQLLHEIRDIKVEMRILNEPVNRFLNPVDSVYRRLNCELKALSVNSPEYKMIEEYVMNTHNVQDKWTYPSNAYKLQVLNVFECNKKEKFVDHGNRMLLWYGSRLTNWAEILKQGLKTAPPEIPFWRTSQRYKFGRGIYFSDRVTKGANNCHATRKNKYTGLLLLCEVSLGNWHEMLDHCKGYRLPQNHHSVKGVGNNVPDQTANRTLSDGTVVPLGRTTRLDGRFSGLGHNKYVIFDKRQAKMRFLVQVRFDYTNYEECLLD